MSTAAAANTADERSRDRARVTPEGAGRGKLDVIKAVRAVSVSFSQLIEGLQVADSILRSLPPKGPVNPESKEQLRRLQSQPIPREESDEVPSRVFS